MSTLIVTAPVAVLSDLCQRPLYHSVSAGFPSPADDYIEQELSLDEHLIQNKSSTFFVRVEGDSMVGVGIHSGDILIVDRSLQAKLNAVIIAILDGEFTVKRLIKRGPNHFLRPENHNYPDIPIDEAFLSLKYGREDDMQRLRDVVLRSTGIPITIGVGKTKTLAKLANHIAKRKLKTGVFVLEPGGDWLSKIPITKVWGIASGYCRRLAPLGVKSVADLISIPEAWMKREFGVVGVRIHKELNGYPCYDLEPPVEKRKGVMVSRSFSHDVQTLHKLEEAIAVYATRLGEKLRKYGQCTRTITVFIRANRFKKNGQAYSSRSVELPFATSNTNELISFAVAIVRSLFKPGIPYKKAGIFADNLVSAGHLQRHLFLSEGRELRGRKIMGAVDAINKSMGKNAVYFASCGRQQSWARKEQWRSPRYTTSWSEILRVKS